MQQQRKPGFLVRGAMGVGMVLPPLCAYSREPDLAFFNQALAVFGFGLLAAALVANGCLYRRGSRDAVSLLLGVLIAASLAAPVISGASWAGSLCSAVVLSAALLTVQTAAAVHRDCRPALLTLLALSLLVACAGSLLVAAVQYFAPHLADNILISMPNGEGRAIGNMRQPNLLATLFLWGCLSAVWLHDSGWMQQRSGSAAQARTVLFLLNALLAFGIVLTASRTGLVGLALLAVWAGMDAVAGRRTKGMLTAGSRAAMLLLPVFWLLAWLGIRWWSQAYDVTFFADTRIEKITTGSSPRLNILRDAFTLLSASPWLGVGWGEFNFAWVLSPFVDRYGHNINHAHNIFVQFLVELGWPVGLAACALLLTGVVRAAKQVMASRPPGGAFAIGIVLIAGLHSLLEFPLWYAFFLLPTAFAYGLCLSPVHNSDIEAVEPQALRRRHRAGVVLAGVTLSLATLAAVKDYQSVQQLYRPDLDAAPFAVLLAEGQASMLFSDYADSYAALFRPPGQTSLEAAERTAHRFIGPRLLIAWAKSLHATGRTDEARYLTDRLREFRSEVGDEFFAPCTAQTAERPFQCEPAKGHYSYRDFR